MKLVFILVLALSAIVAAKPQEDVIIAAMEAVLAEKAVAVEPEMAAVPEQEASALPDDVVAVLRVLANVIASQVENALAPEAATVVLPEVLKYPQTFKTPEARECALKAVIDNWVSIKGHNAECAESGEACDFYRGLWEMSHLTQEEKLDKLCGSFPPEEEKRLRTAPQIAPVVFPTAFDAVLTKNYVTSVPTRVTPVQNQGQCGICWGMTASGVQEGVILKTSTLTGPLSWQQIIDCDTTGFGCSGGYLDKALTHLKTNGQSYLSVYPYGSMTTLQKGTCKTLAKCGKPLLTNVNYVFLNGDEKLLKNYLLQYGPVGIQVQVVGGFTSYRNGTYVEPLCKSTDPVNHSMLLVGFGTDAFKQDYWLIKNTWGTSWGKANPTRVYRSLLEEEIAMEQLLLNNEMIQEYNTLCKVKGCDFIAGLWSNSDWSDVKKEKNLCGSKDEEPVMQLRTAPQAVIPTAGNTLYKNWVTDGRVLPVVNQETCGCCWSFAAVGVAEGLFKGKNPAFNTPLSPQKNIDCDTTNLACNGGNSWKALEYMKANGISTLNNYKYTKVKGVCNTAAISIVPKITTATILQLNGNETLLRDIVFQKGPVAVSMHAAEMFFKYSTGVFNNVTCINNASNHAMLVVGYGSQLVNGVSMDYWLVKNSWGPTWGEQGYIKMRRNANNQCGIARFVYYAE
ncbi:unnamed protein product [Diamesa serratosioi]